jgi:hypothetical protein
VLTELQVNNLRRLAIKECTVDDDDIKGFVSQENPSLLPVCT